MLSTISAHGRALKPKPSRLLNFTSFLSTISAHGRALKLGLAAESSFARLDFQQFRLTVEH